MQKMKIGSPICVIKIEATGTRQQEEISASLTFAENDESFVTAKIAATVAQKMLEQEQPAGIYHIEELFNFEILTDQFDLPPVHIMHN